jgi:hypothetical protein
VPQITTRASAQTSAPGSSISDTVSVSGIGRSTVSIRVELWGPFTARSAITCSGVPYWAGNIVAHGNGSTTTPSVRLERAGYYAFRETITAQPQITAFTTRCGEITETTFVHARPELTTLVSAQLARPGAQIADRIRVHGLGKTQAAVEVELFGPFASRASIQCSYGHLRWHGRITVAGNGETRSPGVTVSRAGFYGYRERLIGTPLITGSTTPCALEAETTLATPRIVTGRGDVAAYAPARDPGAGVPVRVTIPSLGITAPVSPSAIDVRRGVLGIPADIHRVGWWRDGSTPGDRRGTILLAGHRDSASVGAGAFFNLAAARPGELIQVATTGGQRLTYRVATVRSYAKAALPTTVYATGGRPRLVLVTCGGPFDTATGHYPDNVVVTAFPGR